MENRLPQSNSVHWHGIELESYYDGVPGWAGEGRQVTPPIRTGETFVASQAARGLQTQRAARVHLRRERSDGRLSASA
jgi:FtsP/CotA-like multicopper oxidase with cupredoxin domain